MDKLTDYCCGGSKSFFDRNFAAGNFLWLHTPRQHRELFLARYKLHKQRCPELGACLLLPAKYSSPVLKNMTLLRRFARNTPLFVDATSGQTVRCKCDFVVYADKPHVVSATQDRSQFCESTAHDTPDSQQDTTRPSTSHVMQLTGTVAGATANVLFDSGAEQYNYISTALCHQHGIQLRQSKSPLNIVGVAGAAAQAVQLCTATLRMQGLASQLNFVVIDMPAAFDQFCKELHAVCQSCQDRFRPLLKGSHQLAQSQDRHNTGTYAKSLSLS
jgi:hypothetical protein